MGITSTESKGFNVGTAEYKMYPNFHIGNNIVAESSYYKWTANIDMNLANLESIRD